MGLCNIKLFPRRRAGSTLQTAIFDNDVASLERLAAESSLPRDSIVGNHGEQAVLLAVKQACVEEAQRERTMATLKTLLKLGFDPNACSRDKVGMTAVYHAVRHGRTDVLRLLLEAGADHSASTHLGLNPFILAVVQGDVPCVRMLLESGADPNTTYQAIDSPALNFCAPSNQQSGMDITQILLSYGADISRRNGSLRTPLHCTCQKKYDVTNMVNFLLDNGANVNAQDCEGNTPLMLALSARNVATATCLVRRGAHVALNNRTGKTARDVAMARGLSTETIDAIFSRKD